MMLQSFFIRCAQILRRFALGLNRNLFLFLAIPFGLAFLVLSAPFQAPDEYLHFYRSYEIAQGRLVGNTARLEKDVFEFTQKISPDLQTKVHHRMDRETWKKEFSRPFPPPRGPEGIEIVDVTNISVYSPVPYLPQALGIWIGRSLRLPPILIFYIGRLCNLVVWLCLTLLAIRIIPIHPRLLTALALMPMTVFIAASHSPDAFTNGICFLWIAFILYLVFLDHRELRWSDWVFLILLSIPLALCKTIYALLGGLLFLFPIHRRNQWPRYLGLAVGINLLILLVGWGWLQYSISYGEMHTTSQYGMPSIKELQLFIEKPQLVFTIFANSIQHNFFGQAKMMIGILGWLDTFLPDWVYPTYYLLLIFTVIFEAHPDGLLKKLEKTWIAAMGILSYLSIMIVLFNPKMDLERGRIIMAQGRYYIPFAPLFFLPLSQQKLKLREDSPFWVLAAGLQFIILGVAARALLKRFIL